MNHHFLDINTIWFFWISSDEKMQTFCALTLGSPFATSLNIEFINWYNNIPLIRKHLGESLYVKQPTEEKRMYTIQIVSIWFYQGLSTNGAPGLPTSYGNRKRKQLLSIKWTYKSLRKTQRYDTMHVRPFRWKYMQNTCLSTEIFNKYNQFFIKLSYWLHHNIKFSNSFFFLYIYPFCGCNFSQYTMSSTIPQFEYLRYWMLFIFYLSFCFEHFFSSNDCTFCELI